VSPALALLIPAVGAVLIALTGRWPNLRETVTLVTAVTLATLVAVVGTEVWEGARPYAHLAQPLPGIAIAFEVEPLGLLFAAIASGLWIVNSIYSIGYMRGNDEKHQTRFYVCFAIAIFGAMGVAFSANLLTLFLFYEVLTLSTYPLVAHKGDADTIKSARVYLGILLTTSIGLLLPAIIWTYMTVGTVDFIPGGVLATGEDFVPAGILEGTIAGPALGLLLALFVFGVGKAAVMPVHRWLPAAMVAPTPVSALLHAVAVVKAGVFTLLKVIVYIFGIDYLFEEHSAEWLQWLAAFTIIAASMVALRQTNLKRLLAYSTVSQLSYVVLAAAVLKPLSEVGAAVHMVAHAFGKITLFFAAGAIYTACKKTELSELAGIGRRMPWTMAAFSVGAMTMIGVPPTGGFVSKWYILAGAFQSDNYLAIFTIILSTALNAAYFLPVVYAVWLMPETVAPKKDHGEAPFPVVLALTITAALSVLFFFFNAPVLELEYRVVGTQNGVLP
jgi:multicomponent Na+:H+ antiporter subunit D